jgi:2'-5' RNA ligase
MGLLRAFLAAELPISLQDLIHASTAGLHQALGDGLIRWVPPHNVHLTLKFLGDVSSSSLDLIRQMLLTEASHFAAFDVQVEGLGSYPNSRRPRVLWIGLNAPAELASLQRAIEAAAARLGYESEERGFSPHLTIGRVRQSASPADLQKIRMALEENRLGRLGSARVDAIHLFKSELRPEGSEYSRLFSAPLLES